MGQRYCSFMAFSGVAADFPPLLSQPTNIVVIIKIENLTIKLDFFIFLQYFYLLTKVQKKIIRLLVFFQSYVYICNSFNKRGGLKMKKIFTLFLFVMGMSTVSYSQSAGKGGSEKSGGLFSRMFHHEQKPHAQMQHFDKQSKDPKLKHNGTSYGRKSKNKVDGDGFSSGGKSGRKKRKSGVK